MSHYRIDNPLPKEADMMATYTKTASQLEAQAKAAKEAALAASFFAMLVHKKKEEPSASK